MSVEELDTAERLAAYFLESSPRIGQPPLNIFLGFLALNERPKGDVTFMQYILQHYSGEDLAPEHEDPLLTLS